MKRVICDTNIWYYFADGTFKIEDFKDVKLVATPLNVIELGFAHPENKKGFDFKLIQKAAKAILDYSFEIIEEELFEFLSKVITPLNLHEYLKYPYRQFLIKDVLKNMVDETAPISKSDYENKYQSYFVEFFKYKEGFKNILEKFISQKRQEHKSFNKETQKKFAKGKGQHHEWINHQIVTMYIGHLLETDNRGIINKFLFGEQHNDLTITISHLIEDGYQQKKIDFIIGLVIDLILFGKSNLDVINEKFKLYLNALKFYVIELTKQGTEKTVKKEDTTKKVQENDCFDLLNLIYVLKDDIYCTREKQWKRYLKEAGLENQLYKI